MAIETIYGEQAPTYYVFKEGGRAPRFRHRSRYKAEKEAERLAALTPGAVFHVVKLKKSIQNTDAGETTTEQDATLREQFARSPHRGDIVTYNERGVDRQGELMRIVLRSEGTEGYCIRDIIDNIIMPRMYGRDEFEVVTKVEDRPPEAVKALEEQRAFDQGIDALTRLLTGLAARRALKSLFGNEPADAPREDVSENYRGRQIPLNSPVWVIADDLGAYGFAGRAFRATLTEYDEDVRYVWCRIDDEKPHQVNASRVFAIDDPRIAVFSF